jgi:hypothetical protein
MRQLIAIIFCALTAVSYAQTPTLQQVITAGATATTRPIFSGGLNSYGGINVINGINVGNYAGTESINFLYNGAVGAGYQGSFNFLANGITEASFGKVANAGFYFSTYLNHPMSFKTNSLDRLWINGDGNIGINTTSPQSKLDVNGQIRRSNVSNNWNPTLWNNPTGWTPEIGIYDQNGGATGGFTTINNGFNVGLGIVSYDRLFHSFTGNSVFKTVQLHAPNNNDRNYGLVMRTNANAANTEPWISKANINTIYSLNTAMNIGTYGGGDLRFFANFDVNSSVTPAIAVKFGTQNVGIGTEPSANYKLAVNGDAIATKMVVKANSAWPDYVFKPDYDLTPLSTIAHFIKENGHLPEMPTEKEVAENGIDLGSVETKLLKKVEELTLYLLQQQQLIEKQQLQIDELVKKMKN